MAEAIKVEPPELGKMVHPTLKFRWFKGTLQQQYAIIDFDDGTSEFEWRDVPREGDDSIGDDTKTI